MHYSEINLAMSSSRKPCTTTRDASDPKAFLDQYFRKRGITKHQESEALRKVRARAVSARERFKRLRAGPSAGLRDSQANQKALSSAADAEGLTAEVKYNRRLANNRVSAAGARVYSEVLRRELEFSLKEASDRVNQYKEQIRQADELIVAHHANLSSMRSRIKALEQQVGRKARALSTSELPVKTTPMSAPPHSVSLIPDAVIMKPILSNQNPIYIPSLSHLTWCAAHSSRLPPLPRVVPVNGFVSVVSKIGATFPSLLGSSRGKESVLDVPRMMVRLRQAQATSSHRASLNAERFTPGRVVQGKEHTVGGCYFESKNRSASQQ